MIQLLALLDLGPERRIGLRPGRLIRRLQRRAIECLDIELVEVHALEAAHLWTREHTDPASTSEMKTHIDGQLLPVNHARHASQHGGSACGTELVRTSAIASASPGDTNLVPVFLLAKRILLQRALIAVLDAELGAAGGQGPEIALLYGKSAYRPKPRTRNSQRPWRESTTHPQLLDSFPPRSFGNAQREGSRLTLTQILQLQAYTSPSSGSLTANLKAPQWQLPW